MERIIAIVTGLISYWGILPEDCVWQGMNWDGRYMHNSTQIYICQHLPYDEKVRVLLHELGHYFWFNAMSIADHKEWEELRADNKMFITAYASTSAEEDFAENFGIAANDLWKGWDREWDEEVINKYRFVRNLLQNKKPSVIKVSSF